MSETKDDGSVDIFTVKEFNKAVHYGLILPGIDGAGYWGTETEHYSIPTNCSCPGATHVWYYAK